MEQLKPLFIAQSQVVFTFEQNAGIRKEVFDYEEKLKEYLKTPFQFISIPENIHPEIPRFESTSHNGHSKLSVSQVQVNFLTGYSENFKQNISEIRSYLTERVKALQSLVSRQKVQYLAYIVELGFECEKEWINEFIKQHTNVFAVKDDTIDFTLLYSFPYKDKYYLNVKCSKYMVQPIEFDLNTLLNNPQIQSPTIGPTSHGISVTLDLNSRYHLNKGMQFQESFFEEIQNEIFEIVKNNNLQNYLKGELYEHVK